MNTLSAMPNKQGQSVHKTAIDRDKRTKSRIDKQKARKKGNDTIKGPLI